MADEVIRLLLDMGVSKENAQQVVDKLDALRTATVKASDGLDKVKTSSASSGQSLLQTGRVIQDFAQGGLGGILNNIEGLTMALGLGGGLAGILTVLGVVALTAGPAVKSFFMGIIDGSNKVPEAKDRLDALNEAIKAGAKELDGLRDKQALTNTELGRFNDLTAKQIRLESQAAEAKKQRAREEAFDATKDPSAAKRENAQAEAMRNMVATPGGRQQEMTDELSRAMLAAKNKQWEAELDKLPAPANMTIDQRNRQAELARWMGQYSRGGLEHSEDANAKAELARATSGDPAALRRMMGVLPEGSTTREILRLASPEEQEAQRRAARGAEEQRKAHGEAEAEAAQQREWEAQGKANNRAWTKKHEGDRKKDDAGIAADVKKREAEDRERVAATDVDERARSRAAQLAAQGGVDDKYGRFHKLNSKQQERYNANLTEKDIKQRFPQMGQGDRQGIAAGTANQAGKDVRDQVAYATVTAMQAGNNATAANQQAMMQVLQRLRSEEQRSNGLARNARDMQARNPPASDNGHG